MHTETMTNKFFFNRLGQFGLICFWLIVSANFTPAQRLFFYDNNSEYYGGGYIDLNTPQALYHFGGSQPYGVGLQNPRVIITPLHPVSGSTLYTDELKATELLVKRGDHLEYGGYVTVAGDGTPDVSRTFTGLGSETWTHIVSVGASRLLYYDANTGQGQIRRFVPTMYNGNYLDPLLSSPCQLAAFSMAPASWTPGQGEAYKLVVNTPQGVLFAGGWSNVYGTYGKTAKLLRIVEPVNQLISCINAPSAGSPITLKINNMPNFDATHLARARVSQSAFAPNPNNDLLYVYNQNTGWALLYRIVINFDIPSLQYQNGSSTYLGTGWTNLSSSDTTQILYNQNSGEYALTSLSRFAFNGSTTTYINVNRTGAETLGWLSGWTHMVGLQ